MTTRITPTTELEAVNIMLSVIGEAPVNTITGTNSVDVSVAKNVLDETSMSVQGMGWNFNTHKNHPLSLDADSRIPLPSNAVQADADDKSFNITIRNGFIFDLEKHTDIFTKVPEINLVLVQQFEHLPEYVRRYINIKAARRFAARFLAETEIVQLIGQDEQEALVAFHQADSREADVNMLKGDANTFSIINRPPRRTY